jgi:polyphosphate kinase 2 (PPK2 family)
MGRLEHVDLTERINRKEYEQRLLDAQQRFLQLRLHLGGQLGEEHIGPGLLFVMEGPDASGKGGAIRHLVEPLDPRHFRVSSFSKPTADEKRHHHLWRFYRELPGLGGMAVFDRSWYGRVLVERLEGFATPEQWGRGFQEIVDFETTLVHEGVILIKFWLQISDEEQLRRFEERQADPLKRWKLTDEDWRNRRRNRDYEAAAEDMFARTDHELAPWDVLSGEHKRLARVQVIERANERVEEGMRRWGWQVPELRELGSDDD